MTPMIPADPPIPADILHKLEPIHLAQGTHPSPDKGMCLMEAISFIMGEPFSDMPECVCPTIAGIWQAMNDLYSDDLRQEFKRYAPHIIGTNCDLAKSKERLHRLLRWFVEVGAEVAAAKGLPAIAQRFAGQARQPQINYAMVRVLARCAALAPGAVELFTRFDDSIFEVLSWINDPAGMSEIDCASGARELVVTGYTLSASVELDPKVVVPKYLDTFVALGKS